MFEDGHAYVALSRARALEGLLVRNFDPSRMPASAKVMIYYQKSERNFSSILSSNGEPELKEFLKNMNFKEGKGSSPKSG